MAKDRNGFGQRVQNFMSSYRGKVIMNYAYSWGAAIVIAGTLFKLTHLPGANLMLWLGMGTEVLVFFLSAFDLPRKESVPTATGGASGVVVVGGGSPAAVQAGEVPAPAVSGSYAPQTPSGGAVIIGGGSAAPSTPVASHSEMESATQAYVDKLKEMTEMLGRFTEQAESLSHDAEQMQHLKQNLAGINAIYEMQLRSASAQMGTIDQVHEETRRMARQIEELNTVYARMLQAMQAK